MIPPRIETDRLILRMPIPADLAPFARTLADPIRSRYIGGPYDKDEAREDLQHLGADWATSGLGGWCVEIRHTGKFAGVVAINNPRDFPEVELGWTFQAEAEGFGYAHEAIVPMRRFAFDTIGLKTAVSYIDRDNSRSIRLAERLGATLDPKARTPNDDPCLVYRHPAPVSQVSQEGRI